ncbi:ribonuclease J [Rhodoligotrophos appendicifer]|uniref:MBL fold metallo-hydrolase n=1 Tax=Rhodoligotrophos appendicifer TaxID=987056 RepID=UPI001187055D|nr:MBL fold metallo-hydrolase [Rhodoligotrophos appendicifer]
MQIRIHRGTREIGGSCVEVEHRGASIALDCGLPLNTDDIDTVSMPDIPGLVDDREGCIGAILSHGHRDHWGLLPRIRSDLPVAMGNATASILQAAKMFVPGGYLPLNRLDLMDGKPLVMGPFTITPRLVDHSAFDSYAITIDAGGKRLFYSGDLRGHGRKSALFERLVAAPPPFVDMMIMEGSTIGRLDPGSSFPTETDLENEFVDAFTSTRGMALVVCSPQNVDRVVTLYRAARRSNRNLIIDAYAAEILRSTARHSIPKVGFPSLKVFLPKWQRFFLVSTGIASIVDSYKDHRIWPENLKSEAKGTVMLIRPWMIHELGHLNSLDGSIAIWSQWEGYLRDGKGAEFKTVCDSHEIPLKLIHTSGHASIPDLQRLAKAVNAERLVPIHTFQRDQFPNLFDNVTVLDDGEWMEV